MANKISSFHFSVDGLHVTTTDGHTTSSLSLDPCATCALLKDAALIEDFSYESTGEPVILYSDAQEPKGYGYELWCHFVHSFPFTAEMALALMQFKADREQSERTQAIIAELLSPLAA